MSRTKLIIAIVTLVVLAGAFTFVVVEDLKAPTENTLDSVPSVTSSPDTTSVIAIVTYTLSDIALHATKTDCWTTVEGKVYDLTPFVSKHPGGEEKISKICGKDGSTLFGNQHGEDQQPVSELTKLFIGNLK